MVSTCCFQCWCFDKEDASCSSDALARVGFVYSGSRSEPASVKCVFCFKDLVFEEDDPWKERQSHSSNCTFVQLNKPDEKDWIVRDFMLLLSGRIAATQRESILKAAEDFRKVSGEIQQMYKKAMRSTK